MIKLKSKRLKIDKNAVFNLLSPTLDSLSSDLISDLKNTAPVDDTTKEKAEYIYNSTGKKAWIKDGVESRDFWKNDNKLKNKKGIISNSISNNNPAATALALGFISPLNLRAEAVERRQDGLFSEQSPDGLYINDSMERIMKKNNMKNIKTEA